MRVTLRATYPDNRIVTQEVAPWDEEDETEAFFNDGALAVSKVIPLP